LGVDGISSDSAAITSATPPITRYSRPPVTRAVDAAHAARALARADGAVSSALGTDKGKGGRLPRSRADRAPAADVHQPARRCAGVGRAFYDDRLFASAYAGLLTLDSLRQAALDRAEFLVRRLVRVQECASDHLGALVLKLPGYLVPLCGSLSRREHDPRTRRLRADQQLIEPTLLQGEVRIGDATNPVGLRGGWIVDLAAAAGRRLDGRAASGYDECGKADNGGGDARAYAALCTGHP